MSTTRLRAETKRTRKKTQESNRAGEGGRRGRSPVARGRRELAIRSKLAEILLTASDERMYDEVLEVVLAALESTHGLFGYIDVSGALVIPTVGHDTWNQCKIAGKAAVFTRDTWSQSAWLRVLREERTLVSNEPLAGTPEGHVRITRHVSMPLVHRGETLGLMQVANKVEDYGPRDIELLETIGSAIAPVLSARLTRDREEHARREAETELRRHHERLEEQVKERTAELQKQTESLKRASAELTIIMDSIPGLVFYKDATNRFIRVNKFMADAHKRTKEALEGANLFDIYPRETAQAYFDDDLEVIRSGQAKLDIDEPWETESGKLWISTSKIPYFDEEGQAVGVIGVAIDVTERKRAEAALARKNALTNGINRVFREALICETEEGVAATALRVVEELTGAKFGWIGELNDAGLMDTIAISNPGWEACGVVVSDAKNFIKNMAIRGIDRSALKDGKSRIVNGEELQVHPDRVGTPSGHPRITSFLGVPFKREGKTAGMIALGNKVGGFEPEDQEVVEAFAPAFYEGLLRKRMELEVQRQSLLKSGEAQLSERLRGDQSTELLCRNIITFVCSWLEVPCGIIYLADDDCTLQRVAGYAHKPAEGEPLTFRLGEGLVGQAALEQRDIVVADVPGDYFTISSGLGQAAPRRIHIKPIVHDGRVCAVLELGTLHEFQPVQSVFLETVVQTIAFAIESAKARAKQAMLLEETRRQSEEMQAQQEELKAANEELEEQAQRLRESEARLKAQQEELQVTNEELEEKTELLERQKRDVEDTRREIAEKADELALASKYKSEFLANMSHELRTPLNSLLLLARSLFENKTGNLTDEQVESAKVIYQGGNELLSLINEILDLSKIEAGRMDLRIETFAVSEMAASMRAAFRHLAASKGLSFSVSVEAGAPESIVSDRKRAEQVIKNLVANAIKFTERGSVKVVFGLASPTARLRTGLDPREALSIAVEDTGIGVPPEQHRAVFEAFHQGDGGTARRFGGTGLGLSIARELTRILGGEIHLASEAGRGSTFTIFLPFRAPAAESPPRRPSPPLDLRPQPSVALQPRMGDSILDDRAQLLKTDRTILIIEDDRKFAEILAKQCRQRGFKVLAAATGEAGVDLARRFLPRGIVLDLKLPGIDGWRVLELLKEDPATRHIPIHVASVEEPSTSAMRKGAIGHDQKPISADRIAEALAKLEETAEARKKRVLVVEDSEETRKGIIDLIAEDDVVVDGVAGGGQAIAALQANRYDCMILDLGLWDFDGDELLHRIERDEGITIPPIIVYTARDLTWEEDLALRSYSDSVIIKGARSDERLLDEVSLFLHRVVAEMPEKKRQVITSLHDTDALLREKKVLVVDDDMRTLFALTKLLSDRGMEVFKAEHGEKALEVLSRRPDMDIVLMDVMMPVLDGLETMKRIRAQEQFGKTPIIALTAKAMKGDQERCIEAGASDYLPKPVDQDRLLSLMRIWLYR